MNIVFAGTPAFAVPTLAALIASTHTVRAVYTQPDRPAGRGQRVAESAVKQLAQRHALAIRQPPNLRDAVAELARDQPDIMVVIAYGVILPPAVLAVPTYGCVNVHASLLPRWRGAAPIARAIEAGDAVSGITLMQMEAGLDTGPILLQRETAIGETDTAASLHDRLAQLGAELLLPALAALARGELRARAQDAAEASYAAKLRKPEAHIDWSQPAPTLHRKVRAFNPFPVAMTKLKSQALRIWDVGPVGTSVQNPQPPGTIIAVGGDGIEVQTGAGTLTLTRVQLAGGKPIAVKDFLNGQRVTIGDRCGD